MKRRSLPIDGWTASPTARPRRGFRRLSFVLLVPLLFGALGSPAAPVAPVAGDELSDAKAKQAALDKQIKAQKAAVAEICAAEGQALVGWRKVPTDPDKADLGRTARAAAPAIEQLFIAAGEDLDGDAFERKLYSIRKRASRRLRLKAPGNATLEIKTAAATKTLALEVLP